MAKVTAQLKYLHMAPRKVRRIADTMKGLHVIDAQAQLMFYRQRAAQPLLKLLKSAVSNAKNLKLDEARLVVKDIRVDGGPMLKRVLPRAMGRGTIVQKKMSHVMLVLEDSGKRTAQYVIPEVKKKEKKSKKLKTAKTVSKDAAISEHEHGQKEDQQKSEKTFPKTKGLGGFAKKLFQRKSV